jgi:hypothetical protein
MLARVSNVAHNLPFEKESRQMSPRAPDGRQLYFPRNRDPFEDAETLILAILSSSAELINCKDGLLWIDDGSARRMSLETLRALVGKCIATPAGVTERKGRLQVDYQPPTVNDILLGIVLTGRGGRSSGEIKCLEARLPLLDIALPKKAEVKVEVEPEPEKPVKTAREIEDELLVQRIGHAQWDDSTRERFLRHIRAPPGSPGGAA